MEEKQKSAIKDIIEWFLCIIIAIVLALLVRYYIGTPTIVQQPSMFPTLQEGQRLILNRVCRTLNEDFKRGEIVTFEAPSFDKESLYYYPVENVQRPVAVYKNCDKGLWGNFLYYVLEAGKDSYIKRVIGLPGEHVEIKDGYVYINGEKLSEEYLQPNVVTEPGNFADFIVPEGTYFLMGDNRLHSTDSREFGCIPKEKIESKVWIRFWPLDLWGNVK